MIAIMKDEDIEIMIDLVEMTKKDFESCLIRFLNNLNGDFEKIKSLEDIQLDFFG